MTATIRGRFQWTVALPVVALVLMLVTWSNHEAWPILVAIGLALVASVICAVHHAEVVAHRVGEPFGSLILAVAAILPAFSGIGGPVYLLGAVVLNVMLLRQAWAVWQRDEATARGKDDRFKTERRFFGFSIVYLTLHFTLLLVEAALRALDLAPAAWPVLF